MRFIENKLLVVSLVVIIGGFIWYLGSQKPSSSSAAPPNSTSLELSSAFSKGDPNAPVKIVQYSDFLCPSCSEVSLGMVPKIMQTYVDTGKAYYQFRPLAFIAPGSLTAAEGAYCAADQQKFWEYHDTAYLAVWNGYFSRGVDPQQVPLYSIQGVEAIGAKAGVNTAQFNDCLTQHTKGQQIKAYTTTAQQQGINGTPYFIVNDKPIRGVPTYDMLDAAIKAAGA